MCIRDRVEAVSADGGPKDKEAVDWWISRCQQWKEKYPVVLPKHYEAGEDQPANIYAAIKEISRRAEDCLLYTSWMWMWWIWEFRSFPCTLPLSWPLSWMFTTLIKHLRHSTNKTGHMPLPEDDSFPLGLSLIHI